MKVCSVIGARPQIIKAASVSASLRREVTEVLIHTGQHYDVEMSEVHQQESGMPRPEVNLGIGSDTHARMTARMLVGLERVFEQQRPDMVLTYGDTNSTLAAALTAAKLHIRIAHVEAGLRSYDRRMPEEINRILTDHVSTLLCCPTPVAVENLRREGVHEGVVHTGDVMYDSLVTWKDRQPATPPLPEGLEPRGFVLLTLHRPHNVDDPLRLRAILEAIAGERVVFPVHPRTRARLDAGELGVWLDRQERIETTPPIGRQALLRLAMQARMVGTDSGGLQKEAFMLGTPCLTFRDTTEWTETLADGWNTLVDADPEKIHAALARPPPAGQPALEAIYGPGDAAEQISQEILGFLQEGR